MVIQRTAKASIHLKRCTLHDNLSDFQPNYPPPNQGQQKASYLMVLKIICRFSWGGRFVKSDFNPPGSARKMLVRFMSNVVRADVDCNTQEYKESAQIHAQHTREATGRCASKTHIPRGRKRLLCMCRFISARAGLSPALETKARPCPLLNGHPGHTWVSFLFSQKGSSV